MAQVTKKITISLEELLIIMAQRFDLNEQNCTIEVVGQGGNPTLQIVEVHEDI